MSESSSLAKKTVKNAFWNYLSFGLSKGVTFVSTIILARILLPEDFGLMALALIFINYLDVLNDFGVGTALVYKQENPEKTANVAFVLGIISGVLMLIITVVSAPLVSDFFNEPRLVPILQALSINFIVTNLGIIHSSLLVKNLDFRRRAIPQVTRTFTKGIVSIGMALAGYGVWSLVIGQIAGTLIEVVVYWVVIRWRPTFVFDMKIARSLMSYGSQIILLGFLAAVTANIDYLFVGRMMDSTQLGFYTMAYRMPELLILNLVVVIGQVVFPTFAKVQNDKQLLQSSFLSMLRYVALITVPLGVGMAIVAPEFVLSVLGERWVETIPVTQVIALYAVTLSLSHNAGDIYKATGRPGILNQLAIVKLIITVPILWVAAHFTIFHVAAGQLTASILITVLTLLVAGRIINVSILSMLEAIRPAILSAIAMFFGTFILRTQIGDLSPVIRLLLLSVFGALFYIGALWLTGRETLTQALTLFKSRQAKVSQVQ